MNEVNINPKNDIDLADLLKVFLKHKSLIFITTLIFAVVSVIYSLSLPNIYQSQALVSVVEDKENKSGLQFNSSLTSLAGISGITSSYSNSDLAIEVIQSRKFFSTIDDRYFISPDLTASTGWDKGSNEIRYDPDIFDIQKNTWVFDPSTSKSKEPSFHEKHKSFLSLLSINKDKETGFISISFQHFSPEFAKNVLDNIIYETNFLLREQDISQSEKYIGLIQEEIKITNNENILKGLFGLVEKEMEKKILAKASLEYILEIIDPPVIPQKKVSPRRSMICIFGTILGFILSLLFVIIRDHFFLKK